jgi:hypothetical protein
MDVPVGSLPEMVLYTGFPTEAMPTSSTHQGSLRTLIQHLRAQLPFNMSHAELRLHMTEECRPDLIEETPHPEGLRCLCWANVLGVYILSFDIFQRIDGRARLPIVKF